MDPNKKKKAPPVPKFESSKQDQATLQSKLNEFMSEVNKKQQLPKVQPKPQVAQVQKPMTVVEPQKKKLNLLNINEKLASMMNSKKDLMVKPKTIQKLKQENKRKIDIQAQYDPNFPNNYQYCKTFHDHKFQQSKSTDIHKIKIDEIVIPQKEQKMQIEPQTIEEQRNVLEETQQKALKMMQKYGFKMGEGLGKNRQGITTPLTIKKTTDSSCVIAPSAIALNQLIKPEISAKSALDAFHIVTTKVIVLNDIVTIKELDQQIEKQIKAQCEKYAKVENWVVYLLDGQLRIFVEFESIQGAFIFFVKMNEKYFNGNLISIRFYSLEHFRQWKLDEPLHQHISF